MDTLRVDIVLTIQELSLLSGCAVGANCSACNGTAVPISPLMAEMTYIPLAQNYPPYLPCRRQHLLQEQCVEIVSLLCRWKPNYDGNTNMFLNNYAVSKNINAHCLVEIELANGGSVRYLYICRTQYNNLPHPNLCIDGSSPLSEVSNLPHC